MNSKMIKKNAQSQLAFKRQKGASSLEYLMLGAVVIAILIAVIGLNDEIATTISDTLSGLFGEVQDAATE